MKNPVSSGSRTSTLLGLALAFSWAFSWTIPLALLAPHAARGEAATDAVIDNDIINEASGLAVSRRDPDLLWLHNDSGDWSTLYAVTAGGHYRGRVDILGADAVDWEDMAAFEMDGKPWLLIADVGDNHGFRAVVTLYLLPEPGVGGLPDDFTLDANAAYRIDLRFEDGARDVEGVAVDAPNRKIYLLSKRDDPPALYCLPLEFFNTSAPLTAQRVATLATLPEVTKESLRSKLKFAKYRNQPTALDISANGRRWLVTTYQQGLVYQREGNETIDTMLAREPEIVGLPLLPQIEAGGMSADGTRGYFVSEQLPASIVRRPLD